MQDKTAFVIGAIVFPILAGLVTLVDTEYVVLGLFGILLAIIGGLLGAITKWFVEDLFY